MKVYSDWNNIQVEFIRFRKKNIDLISVEKFRVGQQFMKFCSLLYVSCRHLSVNSEPCTAVEEENTFPPNKQRRRSLWNSSTVSVNRYRRI